ncbi:dihydroxyacetone kinase subunit DhaL [Methylohalobius crimeensis]|uniref:dihydroxyacetone kinase subunit DhaL n=1 Tax=Methylohalobius crimeensis TaxID=244365 RepID=UPI0003B4F4E3|nr:dihydroxyacetone kinase subunit DhaL [Methylohalobius crimeensis]
MPLTPAILPDLIRAAAEAIDAHAEEVTALDQTLGDGDHVTNLQRGLKALTAKSDELTQISDWSNAFQTIGMTVMSSVGGASGSLYGTLFVALAKAYRGDRPVAPTPLTLAAFAGAFNEAVAAVQKRGKTEVGEKTMVDTLVPVANALTAGAQGGEPSTDAAEKVKQAAVAGMESTRDLLATKGRASYLGERTRGIVDAGARTSQLMICAITDALTGQTT